MSSAHHCRKSEELQRFLLGQLPAEDSEQVQQHLAVCPRCLDTVSHLQAGDTLIEAMRAQANATAQPEADVVENLIGRLSGLYRKTETSAFDATSPSSSPGSGFIPSSPESLSFLAPPCTPEELGRLGGYRILKVLGAGGMGIVFEAEDPQLQRRVALKVMRPELAARPADRQRFLREARAMAAIEHDHIVAIYQVGEDRGVPFLAMQLLKGETLEDRLRRIASPPLPPGEGSRSPTTLPIAEILRIGREVAAGLAAAHAQGLTHRDVKPPNVWLEKSGRVKILDFGLARPVQDDAHLTQSGLIAGTPQYMAPEQATGQAVDHLSDLFSLGCVLYRITTGRLPFRGPNALAILRSLALEQPPPPHEIRPEVPRALSDLTMRLLAKDPHKRPQSADAVVETLTEIGREAARQDAPTKSASQRMRFLVAAVALLVLGPIAAWYAPAVYRIATNQGLLVIQSDDKNVEVTVAQNGEKVKIVDRKTGQEVTLKAGTYQVELSGSKQAGLTLETDHVTLTRGGMAVVKVWREPPATSPTPNVEPVAPAPLPFVVLNGSSGTETTFASLAEAAAAAKNGDTIEIRGNGPFESPRITIGTQALAIRAGTGFEPVLQIDAQSLAAGLPLIDTWAPLVLEGLHFRLVEDTPGKDTQYQLIISHNARFSATHCRFFLKSSRLVSALWLANSPLVQVRHCEFGGVLNAAIHWPSLTSSHEMEVSDCVCWGAYSMVVYDQPSDLNLRLHRNTFVGNSAVSHFYRQLPQLPAEPSLRPLRIDARNNVFDSNAVLILQLPAPGIFQPNVDQQLLPRCMAWSESKNHYGGNLLMLSGQGESVWAVKSLKEWQSYWGLKDAGSLQGKVLYQGGDVRTRKSAEPDTLALADFRLHADSPGKGAGEGGRDLGANVGQVGPGKAYEAWKKTPAYQEWLIATGQVRDPQPFVRMSAGGKPEFKFSNLAEAVTAARSGDTIEIRANGPFVTEPVKITGKALTLRAGQGFAPVIQLSPAAIKTGATLLETDAALRIEGLEFHRVGTDELPDEFIRNVILSQRSPLYLANCRFLMQGRMSQNYAAQVVESPCWEVRNCFFSGGPLNALYWVRPPRGQMILENCLISTYNYGLAIQQHGFDSGEGSVRLARNTFVAGCPFAFNFAEKNTTRDPAAGPTLVEASGNLFDAYRFALFAQYFPERRALEFKAGQARLHELLAWRDQRNLYRVFEEYLSIQNAYPPPLQIEHGLKGLAEWQAFWEAKDTGSLEGRPLYQSDRLNNRDLSKPEELRVEDFRLKPGSSGQGTGVGGRDLGADVTLVGPGPAYERWKKTPEYQQWLKDTGENVPPPASVAAAVRRPLSPASAAAIARSKQQLAEQAQFGWRGYVVVGRFRLANASLADFQDKVASQLEILADGQMVGIVADPAKPIVFRASGYETAQLVVQDVVKDFDPATQEPIDIGEVALQKLPAAAVPSISGQVTWERPELRSPTTVEVRFRPDPFNTPGNWNLGQAGRISLVVGPDGKFEVPEMSPGKFDLEISAPGFALCRRIRVQLARGGRKEMGQLLLERVRVAKITWVHAQQPPFDTSHPASGELKANEEWRAKTNASYPHDLRCEQFGKQIHLQSGFGPSSYVTLGPGELKDFANSDDKKPFRNLIGDQPALEPGHVYLIRGPFTPYILLRVDSVD